MEVTKKNKARQIFQKINITYPPISTRTCGYQGVRNTHFLAWKCNQLFTVTDCPMNEYVIEANNKNIKTPSLVVALMSRLLTLKRFSFTDWFCPKYQTMIRVLK